MKKFKRIALLILSLGLLYSILVFSLILSSVNDQGIESADSLIILGAQVRGEPAKPSPVLKERLDTALIYLQNNPATKVVVTGGQGHDEMDSEANVMADYLISHGIDPDMIIREDESTNTMENLLNAKKLTDLGQTVVVSNDFHLYRAKMLAKRIGINNVTGLAAKSTTSAKTVTYLREIFALGYGLIFSW